MKIEIIEEPTRFHLHGIGGTVENERYGEVGLRLMNEMWQVVKAATIPTTGINHWVYFPGEKMFVGVELRNPQQTTLPDQLEPVRVYGHHCDEPSRLETTILIGLQPKPG